jgi:hypothetical protein
MRFRREGGNRFLGIAIQQFRDPWNVDEQLHRRAEGARLNCAGRYDKLWDESVGIGGPIRRDQVWFFAAHRYRGNDVRGVDAYYEGNAKRLRVRPGLFAARHQGRLGPGQPDPRDGATIAA